MTTSARGVAHPRAALAGNPSDGYGGAVLAVAFEHFRAEVDVRRSERLSVAPASELIEATVRRFAREHGADALGTEVEWDTSIPRCVGLGGSSAIVIATLRALCSLWSVALDAPELAALALAVETEELGIEAGPQDRVAQAFGGLTFMDFGSGSLGRHEPLDRLLLPPLLVAWRSDSAEESGGVHNDLRARFERGEAAVHGGIAALASCARAARAALTARDVEGFTRCVDATFDARRRMIELAPRHVEMIEVAREQGAGANYTGSGGAIVAVCRDEEHRAAVAGALSELGCASVSVHDGALAQ